MSLYRLTITREFDSLKEIAEHLTGMEAPAFWDGFRDEQLPWTFRPYGADGPAFAVEAIPAVPEQPPSEA